MELHSHPESEDTGPYREPANGSRAGIVVVVVIGALVVLVVVLHLAGVVGPGAH